MDSDKYFLDSSFVIALIFANDFNHKKAVDMKFVLNHDCYINNGVLAEILNISNRYADFETVVEIYYQILDNFKIINEYDIFGYDARSLAIFKKYKGKLGFVDSGIIATISQNEIDNLVTFDKEFKRVDSINVISR